MKPLRWIGVSDNHGDMQDDATVEAIMEFIREYKPHFRVHLGDNWDFRNLRKGASDEERAGSMLGDWDTGADFLSRYFDGGKRNIFLRGNHDERLWHFRHSATGLLRDHAEKGIEEANTLMRKLRVKMLPYDSALGVYNMGKLAMLHGYHAGVGAPRQHAAIYGNCIFGHVHTIESSPVAALLPAEARSIGCVCKRDMDYINSKTGKLRWAQGWAYGLSFPDGTYTLNQARKINGSFYVATHFQEIKAA